MEVHKKKWSNGVRIIIAVDVPACWPHHVVLPFRKAFSNKSDSIFSYNGKLPKEYCVAELDNIHLLET